jgi:hypothetical protein
MGAYNSYSIQQLEDIFTTSRSDQRILRALADELQYRKNGPGEELARRVNDALLGRKREQSARPELPQTYSPRPSLAHGFKPTDEQLDCLDKFRTRGSLKINAFAGTGKTSTLKLLAQESRNRGTYLAFNRSLELEARAKFPQNVTCMTVHDLAYHSMAKRFREDKLIGRLNADQLAETLNLRDVDIPGQMTLRARTLSSMILKSIQAYTLSDESEICVDLVPRDGRFIGLKNELWALIANCVHAYAVKVWDRMRDPQDTMPLGRDGCLKVWAFTKPRIIGDFILLDEAEETSAVVLEILGQQSAQMVYVGDRFQQIYEWQGALNAMESVASDHVANLTTSFRFGQEIAEVASRILWTQGEQRRLTGNSSIQSRIGPNYPNAILGRSNSAVMGAVLEALSNNRRPYVAGGTQALKDLVEAVMDLKAGIASEHPEFFGFATWNEVLEFIESGEGEHMITLINILRHFSEKQLIWALNRCEEKESNADIIVSTAHKAKWRDWDAVRLTGDFLSSKQVTAKEAAELRLLYVALTRGRISVDIAPETLAALQKASASTGVDGPDLSNSARR